MDADESSSDTHTRAVVSRSSSTIRTGKYVRLNIGGSLFQTTADTLTKQGVMSVAIYLREWFAKQLNAGEHMFSAMFSGRMAVKADEDGLILFVFRVLLVRFDDQPFSRLCVH